MPSLAHSRRILLLPRKKGLVCSCICFLVGLCDFGCRRHIIGIWFVATERYGLVRYREYVKKENLYTIHALSYSV